MTLTGVVAAAVAIPAPAYAEPGKELCQVTDDKLGELSGLAAVDGGYAAIGDGSDGNVTQVDVVQLDDKCQTTGTVTGFAEPADPEDLAVDSDGNFWVADTGDNNKSRPTIALHKITADGSTIETYRFVYPGGEKYDSEALLLQPDGTPIFATKELGATNLYKPEGGLDASNQQAPLKKVATVKIKSTKTKGGPEEVGGVPLGDAPSMFVTGGAVSPDGKKAVLRTYTDAYEWSIEGGDVAKSINDGKPTMTPLPEEPQGEAITYSTDGKKFITGSEAKLDESGAVAKPATMWSYTPAKAAGSDKKKDDEAAPEQSLLDFIIDTLGISGILWVVAGIGVIGLVLVVIGGRVILRARKRRNETSNEPLDGEDDYDRPRYRDEDDGYGGGRLFEPAASNRHDGYDDDRYGEPRSGSVYGGGYDEPRSGSVYGGGYDEPRSGSVYGDRYDEPRSGGYGGGRDRRDDEPNSGTVYGGRR